METLEPIIVGVRRPINFLSFARAKWLWNCPPLDESLSSFKSWRGEKSSVGPGWSLPTNGVLMLAPLSLPERLPLMENAFAPNAKKITTSVMNC